MPIKEVLLLMLDLPSPLHSTFFFPYARQYRPRKKTQKAVEDLKLTLLPMSFNFKPWPNLEQENKALPVTWQHNLFD